MQHYIYDASGERVLKASSDMEAVYQNGSLLNNPGSVSINGYTSYPSAFLVITADGIYSKHYYAGTQRIVSRLGDTDASLFEVGCGTCKEHSTPKDLDTKKLQQDQKADLQLYADQLKKGTIAYKEYKPTPLAEQEKALLDEQSPPNEQRPRCRANPFAWCECYKDAFQLYIFTKSQLKNYMSSIALIEPIFLPPATARILSRGG